MKHEVNTVLHLLPGGNKYKVTGISPTKGSEFRGLYLLECVDYWCSEDLGDGTECNRLGQRLWVASFHADFMPIWQSPQDFTESGLK